MERIETGLVIQLDLFNDEVEEQAIRTILKLKQQARTYRQTANQLEKLIEELEDSLNAKYS